MENTNGTGTNGGNHKENQLGELLGTYIQEANLSQERLAELIGVSRRAVVAWLRGEYGPDEKNIYRLIELFVEKSILKEPEKAEQCWQLAWHKRRGKSYKEAFDQHWFEQLFNKSKATFSLPYKTSRTDWSMVSKIAQGISEQRAGELLARYKQERALYLQRETVKKAFDDFLNTDKTVFLLLGKAGVGKSFFFLSLLEEYKPAKGPEAICLLLYNAAKLDQDGKFSEVLLKDWRFQLLSNYPELPESEMPVSIEELLLWLAGLRNKAENRLLLFIDAVNENEEAQNLVRQINQLVDLAAVYPWFKIVFSSRPEAWRTLKSRVPLSGHRFYTLPGQAEAGIELEPFSLGVKLPSFEQAELPQVYENYRRSYTLQTEYNNLTPELRLAMRDPLTLKLVASIYQGRTVPERIQPGQLYQQYVEQLVKEERLREIDLAFLETELLPLMIDDQHYTKAITPAQLKRHLTEGGKGKPLYQLILLGEIAETEGHWSNQSYRNLVDCEILVRRGTLFDYEIGFKYERFYDYYAGKRLYQLVSDTQQAKPAAYQKLVNLIPTKPFMWGAVKNALLQEALENDIELLLSLCYTSDQRVKELMVKVLTELGLDKPEMVKTLLKNLLPVPKLSSDWDKLQRFLPFKPPKKPALSQSLRNTRKIGIEVAKELRIVELLKSIALDSDADIRTTVLRHSYLLWRSEPEAGFEILEYLAKIIFRGHIPDFRAAEAALVLSLLFFFDKPQETSVLARLRTIWREVINKIFGLDETGQARTGWQQRLRAKIIISFAISQFLGLVNRIEPPGLYNAKDMEAFFKERTPAQKELYRRICLYLDASSEFATSQSIERENDLFEATQTCDLLTYLMSQLAITAYCVPRPLETLPFLQTYFQKALSSPEVNLYVTTYPNTLSSVLEYLKPEDEIFVLIKNLFEEGVRKTQNYYVENMSRLKLNYQISNGQSYFLGPVVWHHFRQGNSSVPSWLKAQIEQAIGTHNTTFFEELINREISSNINFPKISLTLVGLFFNRAGPEIDHLAQNFLKRMYRMYPDAVEIFLEEQQISEERRLRIITGEFEETPAELIGIKFWQFFWDIVIIKSPILRHHLTRVYIKAADYQDVKQWFNYVVRYVINLVYGEEILQYPGVS